MRTDGRFVRGVLESVVEVADTTRYNDLGPRPGDDERAVVLESFARAPEPDEVP